MKPMFSGSVSKNLLRNAATISSAMNLHQRGRGRRSKKKVPTSQRASSSVSNSSSASSDSSESSSSSSAKSSVPDHNYTDEQVNEMTKLLKLDYNIEVPTRPQARELGARLCFVQGSVMIQTTFGYCFVCDNVC